MQRGLPEREGLLILPTGRQAQDTVNACRFLQSRYNTVAAHIDELYTNIGLDLLASLVLNIVLAVIVLVFWLMGSTPGHVARRRGHPWAEAVAVAGWITLIFGFVLWPVAMIWAYVDVPAKRTVEPRP